MNGPTLAPKLVATIPGWNAAEEIPSAWCRRSRSTFVLPPRPWAACAARRYRGAVANVAGLVQRVFALCGRAQGPWPAAPDGLVGGAGDEVRTRLSASPDDDRATLAAILDSAPDAAHRAVLEAALAAGHAPDTLGRLADLFAATAAADLPAALDPLARTLRQRSATTCGSASLLVARSLHDPVYAAWLLDGADARTDAVSEEPVADRFAAAELTVKDRTNALLGPAGLQVPWPQRFGTPPWGAAAEMTRITGRRYRARYLDPRSPISRAAAYDAVGRVVGGGATAPVFVGSDAMPRHVVLAVGREDGALRLYEPASGAVVRVPRGQFVDGGFRVAGWTVPWAVVVPR